jgi:hypothetical protein
MLLIYSYQTKNMVKYMQEEDTQLEVVLTTMQGLEGIKLWES